uniref:Xylanolytic transcriptional activator regulatory domain-containing protein n=1 Tax=Moniliophthora roreri TaxID=221103 RepID=A0A0W0FSS2_MONRR
MHLVNCRIQRATKKSDSARSLVNRILSTAKPFDVPKDPEVVRKILVDLANFARSLDRQLAEIQGTNINEGSENFTSSTTSKFTYRQEPPEIKDSIESLTQDFEDMLVDIDWRRHYGKSSNNMFIQIALDAKRDELDKRAFAALWSKYKRPELWQCKPLPWQRSFQPPDNPHLEFPESDLLDELVAIYFEDFNQFFPLLHRPTFELSRYVRWPHKKTNDPRNMPEDTSIKHSVGWRWFCQIPLIRPSLNVIKLYDLQLCVLSAFYLQMTAGALVEAAWTTIGLGIRCAQQEGLHRRKLKRQKPTIEDELWKRAFWILVSTDLVISIYQGRPRATTPDDFDAELPAECDDEFWDPADPELAFKQPEGKPSTTAFFLSLLKLVEILGFAERTVASYGVRQSDFWKRMGISKLGWKQKAISELDAASDQFLDTVPDHLKWDPHKTSSLFFKQSVMLYTFHHWVRIQIHRPFIPRPGEPPVLSYPSLTICTDSARTLAQIFEVLDKRAEREHELLTCSTIPTLITPLLTAIYILLMALWRDKRGSTNASEYARDMNYVHQCMDVLKRNEARYQMVARVFDVLNAVINIGQSPIYSIPPTGTQDSRALIQQECFDPVDAQASTEWRNPDPHTSLPTEFATNGPVYSDSSIHAQQVPPTIALEQSMDFPCTDLCVPYYPQQVINTSVALPFGADIQAPRPLVDSYATSNSYSSVRVPPYQGYNQTLESMSGAGTETGGSGDAMWPERLEQLPSQYRRLYVRQLHVLKGQ